MKVFMSEVEAWQDRCKTAEASNEEMQLRLIKLEDSLKWFFEMLEAKVLVRSTTDDADSDWHGRMIALTFGLQKAKAALT